MCRPAARHTGDYRVTCLDLEKLAATALRRDPYDFFVVEEFVRPDALKPILADFPDVPGAGSHPPSELDIRGHFKSLMDELEGPAFRKLIETKFDLDLSARPTMYTVRGFTREKDGSIHTDSTTKIVTVLLYLNEQWDKDGGRLRILRNGTDIGSHVAEVSPNGGTLLVFRRCDHSWHGHLPFDGRRRTIQMNWVTEQSVVDHEQGRHRFSTRMKKLKQFFMPKASRASPAG